METFILILFFLLVSLLVYIIIKLFRTSEKGSSTASTPEVSEKICESAAVINQTPTVSAPIIETIVEPYISVGVDGCKGGWIAVAISDEGFEVNIFKNINDICNKYNKANYIIIDMPIGIPEGTHQIRPDSVLRNNLRGKASSVFNTPCRQALYAVNYPQAVEENLKYMNKSLSKQSYAIIPKIKEIDTFLQENETWKNRLVESHPEYCFSVLNGGNPILTNKQTSEGAENRLQLISRYYKEAYEVIKQYKRIVPSAMASKIDDVLDALVMAIIGRFGMEHGFYSLPANPYYDSTGLKMQIISANLK